MVNWFCVVVYTILFQFHREANDYYKAVDYLLRYKLNGYDFSDKNYVHHLPNVYSKYDKMMDCVCYLRFIPFVYVAICDIELWFILFSILVLILALIDYGKKDEREDERHLVTFLNRIEGNDNVGSHVARLSAGARLAELNKDKKFREIGKTTQFEYSGQLISGLITCMQKMDYERYNYTIRFDNPILINGETESRYHEFLAKDIKEITLTKT